jgi:hypothetical protein
MNQIRVNNKEHNRLGTTPQEAEFTSLNLHFPLSLGPKVTYQKDKTKQKTIWITSSFFTCYAIFYQIEGEFGKNKLVVVNSVPYL